MFAGLIWTSAGMPGRSRKFLRSSRRAIYDRGRIGIDDRREHRYSNGSRSAPTPSRARVVDIRRRAADGRRGRGGVAVIRARPGPSRNLRRATSRRNSRSIDFIGEPSGMKLRTRMLLRLLYDFCWPQLGSRGDAPGGGGGTSASHSRACIPRQIIRGVLPSITRFWALLASG